MSKNTGDQERTRRQKRKIERDRLAKKVAIAEAATTKVRKRKPAGAAAAA